MASGNWTNSAHWLADPGRYPGSEGTEDIARIDLITGSDFTVTLNTNPILESFTLDSAQATFSANNHTFGVSQNSLLAAGSIVWNNSTWNGGAGEPGQSLEIKQGANLLIRNQGRFEMLDFLQEGTVTIEGSASAGHSVLSVPQGFTNRGTMIFTSVGTGGRADVQVDAGNVLLNDADGIIELRSPTSSRNRDFLADLDNHGTFTILDDAIARFNRDGGTYINRGSLNIGPSGTVEVFPGRTLIQADGMIDNQGIVAVSQGALQHTGGNIIGNRIGMNGASLSIGPDAGAGGFLMSGTGNTIAGDPTAGHEIVVEGRLSSSHAVLQAAEGFTNYGRMELTSTGVGGRAEVHVTDGTLINEGTVEFLAPFTARDRDLTGDFENRGTVSILDNAVARYGLDGDVFTNLGTLRTGPEGTLTLATGRTLAHADGLIENEGSIVITQGAFQHTGGSITGNRIDLNGASLAIGSGAGAGGFLIFGTGNTISGNPTSGHEILVEGRLSSSHAVLQAAEGFTNFGRMELTSIGTGGRAEVRVTDGTLINEGTVEFLSPTTSRDRDLTGNFENRGTVAILDNAVARYGLNDDVFTNKGDLHTGPLGALTLASGRTLVHDDGSITNEGSISLTQAAFSHTGGTMSGNPVLLNQSSLHIGPDAGAGFFVMEGTSTFTGNSTEDHLLTVRGISTAGHAHLISAEGFTNRGIIHLTSSGTGGRGDLTISDGALTNEGVIRLLSPTTSRIRNLQGSIDNAGTFLVLDDAIGNHGNPDDEFTNRGLLQVGPMGQLNLGTGVTFIQSDGNLFTEGTFTLTGGEFHHTGGIVTGNPVLLSNSSIHIAPTAGAGTYVVEGNTSFSGDVAASQILAVRGISSSGHARLTSAETFTNRGTLEMTSSGTGGRADIEVIDGVLINEGTLNLKSPTTSRFRDLLTDVQNNGTINVLDNAIARLTHVGGVYTNAGTIRLAALAEAQLPAGRTLLQASGGKLVAELNATGGFGRITGAGTITLDGTLVPSTPDQFAPPIGATFVILSAGSLDGTFSSLAPSGGLPGRWWELDYSANSVTLRVVAGAVSLEDWLAERFTSDELADPDFGGPYADPSGTGVPNVLSYLLGLDPRAPDLRLLPAFEFVSVDDEEEPPSHHAGLTYNRRITTEGMDVSYEYSSDLVNWDSASVTEEILDAGQVMETVRVILNEPLANEPRIFLRLALEATTEP